MKNLYFVLISCFFAVSTQAQTDTLSFRKLAQSIQQQYAPDSRSVYFKAERSGDTIYVESSSSEALRAYAGQPEKYRGMKLATSLLPAKDLNGLSYGVANLSVTNNRRSPGHAPEMMTQMLLGTPVHILKKEKGYFLVRTPDGYLSYTEGRAVAEMDSLGFRKWQGTKKVIFTADYGNAYSEANTGSRRISDLVAGNVLQVLSEDKNFYRVSFPDQRIAYVQKTQAQAFEKWGSKSSPSADQILKTAERLIGVPYLWGGTSLKGVDCSGFTKTSYFLNGVIIPRDASQQALVGTKVDIEEKDSVNLDKCLKNLKAGDLLFFSAAKLRGVQNGRVTHTAIYIGDGKFIQALGMVMISSLKSTDPDYDSRERMSLVSARRILTDIGKPEITRVQEHPWYNPVSANSL
jgi:cell wall-associated NlpC family hydrolase